MNGCFVALNFNAFKANFYVEIFLQIMPNLFLHRDYTRNVFNNKVSHLCFRHILSLSLLDSYEIKKEFVSSVNRIFLFHDRWSSLDSGNFPSCLGFSERTLQVDLRNSEWRDIISLNFCWGKDKTNPREWLQKVMMFILLEFLSDQFF